LNFATGLTSFIFDPAYASNGVFYTLHMEDPATDAPAAPKAAVVPGLDLTGYMTTPAISTPTVNGRIDREVVLIEWKDRNLSNTTFEGTARELLRLQHPMPIHPLGEMTFNPAARPSGAGSNSIRGIYEDMRRVGATARMMLVPSAAKRWNVRPEECVAKDHVVTHVTTGRTLGFGDLALEAGKQKVPPAKDVVLRPTSELPHLGKPLPLLDAPSYVNGQAIYGADVMLPGMLTAVIARPPVVGERWRVSMRRARWRYPVSAKSSRYRHRSRHTRSSPGAGSRLWRTTRGRRCAGAPLWMSPGITDRTPATTRRSTARSLPRQSRCLETWPARWAIPSPH
jgi:hypothetical protein